MRCVVRLHRMTDSAAPPEETDEARPRPWLFTGPAEKRLAFFTDTMRAISRHRDPQELVADYYRRMYEAFPTDGYLSLSRRGLHAPYYQITRSSAWGIDFNPWLAGAEKPTFDKGLLGKLIYDGQPRHHRRRQLQLRGGRPGRRLLCRDEVASGRADVRRRRVDQHGHLHAQGVARFRSRPLAGPGLGQQPLRQGDEHTCPSKAGQRDEPQASRSDGRGGQDSTHTTS